MTSSTGGDSGAWTPDDGDGQPHGAAPDRDDRDRVWSVDDTPPGDGAAASGARRDSGATRSRRSGGGWPAGLSGRNKALLGGGALIVVLAVVLALVLTGGSGGSTNQATVRLTPDSQVGGGPGEQSGTGPAHDPQTPPALPVADAGRLGQATLDKYELTPRDAGYKYHSDQVGAGQHSLSAPSLTLCGKSFPSESKRAAHDLVMFSGNGEPTVVADLVQYKAGGATAARQEVTAAVNACTSYALPKNGTPQATTLTDAQFSTNGVPAGAAPAAEATPAPPLPAGTVIVTGRISIAETQGYVTVVYLWRGPVMSVVSVTAPVQADANTLAVRLAGISAARLAGQ